jgi:type II secretory pathway component HofQ
MKMHTAMTYCLAFLVFAAARGAMAPVSAAPRNQAISQWSWQEAEIRSVFRQLSEFSGVDIVVDPEVSGAVTLHVTDKTWKQVFSIVCRLRSLASITEDGYIYVLPNDSFRKRRLADATSLQEAEKLNPLKREVVKLRNTTAAEMAKAINDLLSPRGKTTVVEHNNAMIIYDTQGNIAQIKEMIAQLDVETEQISISAKIIEVSSGVVNNLGVRWAVMGEIDGNNASIEHLPGANVIAGALERVTYGILSPSNFDITLEYLFSENDGEIVAQPQITTLDNKQASIFMGQQVPVTYLDEAGNTNIQLIDAGTELEVTPHVTGNGRIMLELRPQKRSYEFVNGLPVINEQSANTQVVVSDGETVVIAGLTSNEQQNAEGGIPVLKDIPLLGHLFKRSQKRVDKRDLIIFVTPHIIKKRVSAATHDMRTEPLADDSDAENEP